MKTDEIRRLFLEFFRSKGHAIVPSDSLVPKDDPTLLFTGAGMNQFKDKFLGRNVTYRRAASCQKCLRTADLENVGRTASHHTFFEMLGNFSFGDYFKKDAIAWAWEFLTRELKLKEQDLWASVYTDDDEAYDIWEKVIGLPRNRIIRLGQKENFWPSEAPSKGPNGPCGPCSEIFYDRGAGTGCGRPDCSPACSCGRFVEVWNLVFTQFDRQPDGGLKPLPGRNIDTGMGLERLASVMQGVKTNFEIDIFKTVIKTINNERRTTLRLRSGQANDERRNTEASRNAIADHIRAVVFAIADGVMPSNEERGYVIRKLIRRAASHGRDLNLKAPFLYRLVPAVVDAMKGPYPELLPRRDDIAQVVKHEEESFEFVIQTQMPKVEEAFEKAAKAGDGGKLPEIAFNFYDTYGMPYDMLEEIAERFRLKIDKGGFDGLLERQRKLSRSGSKIRSEIFSETFAKKVEALGLKTEFTGYDTASGAAKVAAVLDGGEVILDRTPFYGESGGQAGDRGSIETESGVMEVEDTRRIGRTIVHIGRIVKGRIEKGQPAKARIDEDRRRATMANHTATHLLQAALRQVLGEHVRQTGSLVDSERLRFDFTHMKKMDERELARAEEIVNENIRKSVPVKKEMKGLDEAKREGAIALFDEKYDKQVRVVSVAGISKELCGGTHVDNTGDIGLFKIMGESSIASGVRRIEAVTGEAARKWLEEEARSRDLKLKARKEKEEKEALLRKRCDEALSKADLYIGASGGAGAGGTKIICEIIEGADMEILRKLADRIKAKVKSAVIVLAAKEPEKASFVVAAAGGAAGCVDASALAKELAGALNGSAGGRPDFAQGGGRNPSALGEALEKIRVKVEAKVKERTR